MYKFLPIIHVLSKLGLVFGLTLLAPAFVSYLYDDGLVTVILLSSIVTIGVTYSIWTATLAFNTELKNRDSFPLVALIWLCFGLVAALPFYFGIENFGFTNAFYEAISGLTTTGSTVIGDLDNLEPSLNFWRHMLNWLGGMGIIVLAVAILPLLGVGGMQLYRAEVPGINKDKKLAPRIAQTAKNMWIIYLIFTLIVIFALKVAGMNWLDAFCHGMASLSLGGFSTHNDSVAYFNSVSIELIMSIGMLLGAINFANHFYAVRSRDWRVYKMDEEFRLLIFILFGSIIVVSLYLWHKDFYSLPDAFRFVGFNFVSIGLASGFTNADFGQWPLIASLWMLLLSHILANSGSTGGGIKMIRAIVLFKYSLREMTLLLHPNAVQRVKVNGRTVPERTALTVLAFIFVYFVTVVVFTFLMMSTGMDFITALSVTSANITNTGPGLGNAGPSYSFALFSNVQKWLSMCVMILGRLEIFTVLILFTPAYWRK